VKTALDGKVASSIPTVSGDLNTYITTGFYHVPASTTNAPTTATYELIVISNGTNIAQIAVSSAGNGLCYQRYSSNNGASWGAWYQIMNTTTHLTSFPAVSTTTALTPYAMYQLGFTDNSFSLSNGSTSDLNTLSTSSFFKYIAGTNANMPSGISVQSFLVQYRIDANNFIQHLWTNEATPRYFIRAKTAGTWGSWTQVETTSGAQTKANTAESNAKTYSDTQLGTHTSDYVKHPGFGSTTGTANTYSITLTPAPTSYLDGMAVSIKINVDSTGASTLNVNGLGAKGLKKANGTDITNLKANGVYTFRYNSSTGNFIVQGEGGAGNAVASDLLTGKTASTDAGDITGTMPNNGAVTITPGTTNQTIAAGYHNGSGAVNGDPDLIASNIKSGVDIFGVVGTVDIASLGGKRFASGTLTNGATQQTFTDYSGANVNKYFLNVTGLSFQPSYIIVYRGSSNWMGVFNVNTGNTYDCFYSQENSGSPVTSWFQNVKNKVLNGSFTVPVFASSLNYSWIAFE
jgi:hypothetical protein